jgi:hypothetical protein
MFEHLLFKLIQVAGRKGITAATYQRRILDTNHGESSWAFDRFLNEV